MRQLGGEDVEQGHATVQPGQCSLTPQQLSEGRERGDTLSHADSRACGGVGGGTMTEDTTSQTSLLALCSVSRVIHLSFKSKPQ